MDDGGAGCLPCITIAAADDDEGGIWGVLVAIGEPAAIMVGVAWTIIGVDAMGVDMIGVDIVLANVVAPARLDEWPQNWSKYKRMRT